MITKYFAELIWLNSLGYNLKTQHSIPGDLESEFIENSRPIDFLNFLLRTQMIIIQEIPTQSSYNVICKIKGTSYALDLTFEYHQLADKAKDTSDTVFNFFYEHRNHFPSKPPCKTISLKTAQ